MATIRKHGNKWQARIQRRNQSVAKSFTDRRDAERWARAIEREIDTGAYVCRSSLETMTLDDLLARYAEEVSPHKKGAAQEQRRLAHIRKDPIAKTVLAAMNSNKAAAFRDRRLKAQKIVRGKATGKTLMPRTVAADLAAISTVLECARREWGIPIANVVRDVRKPTANNSRERRLEGDEEARLLQALATTGSPWARPLCIVAIETAARRGELLGLRWSDVDLAKRTALFRDTKNGADRVIPLSTRAIETLRDLPRSIGGQVFPISEGALQAALRGGTRRAGITGLRLHDLRHEAVSRLFEKGLNTMEVAAISGHKTLAMLARYTHLKAEELARKLG